MGHFHLGMSSSTTVILLLSISLLSVITLGQVEIKEKGKNNGYITMPEDGDNEADKDIYTSMHDLHKFFEREKVYIEDIQVRKFFSK